jgi:hypothetical protein
VQLPLKLITAWILVGELVERIWMMAKRGLCRGIFMGNIIVYDRSHI